MQKAFGKCELVLGKRKQQLRGEWPRNISLPSTLAVHTTEAVVRAHVGLLHLCCRLLL